MESFILILKIIFNYVDIITDINFLIYFQTEIVKKFTFNTVQIVLVVAILFERYQSYVFLLEINKKQEKNNKGKIFLIVLFYLDYLFIYKNKKHI